MISLSKTKEFGQAIDSEHLSHSELTEEEEVQFTNSKLGGFARLDRKFFIPFFTRIFSNQVRKSSYYFLEFIKKKFLTKSAWLLKQNC